jgi:hypothetical protein
MKNILETLTVNVWWKFVLMLGVVISGVALTVDVKILSEKHFFGLGVGLIFIGVSCLIANKHINIPYLGGMLSTEKLIHTPITKILFAIGLAITILFLTLLIIGLL